MYSLGHLSPEFRIYILRRLEGKRWGIQTLLFHFHNSSEELGLDCIALHCVTLGWIGLVVHSHLKIVGLVLEKE